MTLTGQRVLVTGGAGFVGSHLVARLLADNEVRVVDSLVDGKRSWVPDGADLVVGDLTEPAVADEAFTREIDIVFHLAADTDAARDDIDQFRSNNRVTETVIQRMEAAGIDRLAFTSSSTVYGEAPRPTPESYGPLEPISIYGASKLAEEGLLSVYGHSHDFTVRIFRFANVVGPRLRGAVIPDFIEKLRANPDELEILGDGRQEKSYLHVADCVAGLCYGVSEVEGPVEIFNLGTETTTSVDQIATIVAEEMGLDPERSYTGGRQGWTGDVPRMRLDIEKLTATGWEPTLSSDDAVRQATRDLLDEL
jgi:UDP-glucose 4-epimerase